MTDIHPPTHTQSHQQAATASPACNVIETNRKLSETSTLHNKTDFLFFRSAQPGLPVFFVFKKCRTPMISHGTL